MAIPALVVTCESTWLAPIRMPGALARAGFEVTLLSPPDALAARSRHVARSHTLPDKANAQAWLLALAAAVDAARPAIVFPGDETSLRLMQTFVLTPPRLLSGATTRMLADLFVHSIGVPRFYDAATDKARLAPLMRDAGVRVPEYVMVHSAGDAARAAYEFGEVVVKPSNGTGSRDVVVCTTPDAAADAFRRACAGNRGLAVFDREPAVLVQRRIRGPMLGRTGVAFRGRELAGFARQRLHTIRPLGGSTVVRYLHAPEATQFSRRTADALGLTGFFSLELCIDAESGFAYLIDLTRRMAPPTHTGALVGVDLCAALARALVGQFDPPLDLPPDFSHTMTLFPQEFWRDPQSPALRAHPMDVPWDDPHLLRELLQWGYEI
ncbi:MAG TPA: hypothetical protein VF304_17670 [Casimicrobiaceae bacterium]